MISVMYSAVGALQTHLFFYENVSFLKLHRMNLPQSISLNWQSAYICSHLMIFVQRKSMTFASWRRSADIETTTNPFLRQSVSENYANALWDLMSIGGRKAFDFILLTMRREWINFRWDSSAHRTPSLDNCNFFQRNKFLRQWKANLLF